MAKRTTIKDVAKQSGTSTRTVSRVINDDPNVKKETRAKVKEVIARLGFEANTLARSLKAKRTNQIVVFIDHHEGRFWGMFHNAMIHELYKHAKQEGYRMIISSSSADSFEEDKNDGFYLIKHGLCDGAIMFDTKSNDKRIAYLKEYDLPFVIIGKDEENYDTPFVDLDNEYAGYLGAETLMSKGYKHFHFMLGSEAYIVNKERAKGFNKSCDKHGLKANQIHFDVIGMETAYAMTKEILKDKTVDAIFISGDERAVGVYRAIQEQGLVVGKDIGVLGIDNIELSAYLYPALTTIDQPVATFSDTVFGILLKQLANEAPAAKRILITPEIVERQSLSIKK